MLPNHQCWAGVYKLSVDLTIPYTKKNRKLVHKMDKKKENGEQRNSWKYSSILNKVLTSTHHIKIVIKTQALVEYIRVETHDNSYFPYIWGTTNIFIYNQMN